MLLEIQLEGLEMGRLQLHGCATLLMIWLLLSKRKEQVVKRSSSVEGAFSVAQPAYLYLQIISQLVRMEPVLCRNCVEQHFALVVGR